MESFWLFPLLLHFFSMSYLFHIQIKKLQFRDCILLKTGNSTVQWWTVRSVGGGLLWWTSTNVLKLVSILSLIKTEICYISINIYKVSCLVLRKVDTWLSKFQGVGKESRWSSWVFDILTMFLSVYFNNKANGSILEQLIFHLNVYSWLKQMHRRITAFILDVSTEGTVYGDNSSDSVTTQTLNPLFKFVTSTYIVHVHSCDLALIYLLVNICIVISKVFSHI